MSFLQYAYLQTGQNDKALQLIDQLKEVPGITPGEIEDSQASFRARYTLETHDWKMAAELQSTSTWPVTWWARAIGAARDGDAPGARADIKKLGAATADAKAKDRKQGYEVKDEKTIVQLEAEAWLIWAEDKKDGALKALRAVADREDSEGVDDLAMPAREMLIEANQPEAALAAYQTALKELRNRLDSLHGVELAAKATGKGEVAAGIK
jgi:hypothetical protein